jgi:recombinase
MLRASGTDERVALAWANKRKRAAAGGHVLTPTRPAWVNLVGDKLVENQAAGRTVRRIFREVASGMGCYTVAKRLQKDRVPTLSGDKRSRGWNKSRVLAIVTSDAPLGVLHTHKRDGKKRIESLRICRRLVGLSHAAAQAISCNWA